MQMLSFMGSTLISGAAVPQVVSLGKAGAFPVGASGRAYQLVAPNQANAAIGLTGGAIGDDIDGIWIFPGDAAATGAVTVKDGAIAVWVWPAAQPLSNLAPIFVPLNLKSVSGVWNVSTGGLVIALAFGRFT